MTSRAKNLEVASFTVREDTEVAAAHVPGTTIDPTTDNSDLASSSSSSSKDGLREYDLDFQRKYCPGHQLSSELQSLSRSSNRRASLMSEASDSTTNSYMGSPPLNSLQGMCGGCSVRRPTGNIYHTSQRDGRNRTYGDTNDEDFWEPAAPIDILPGHTQPMEWCALASGNHTSSDPTTDKTHSSSDCPYSHHRTSVPATVAAYHSERGSRYERSLSLKIGATMGATTNVPSTHGSSINNFFPSILPTMVVVEEEEEEFGGDTEHIDFSALKGRLHVFRPGPDVDVTDSKGKYVFYSLRTGLLRHHILAEIGKRQGVGVKSLSEVMRSGPFWLDICNPTVEELRALCEIFKMHPLTLEGLESEGEDIREKCDVFEKYYFVCIRAFDADANSYYYMRPINLFMLVSPSCVVTIHRDPLEFSHTIAKRMRLLTARTGLASDWIVYTILEDVLEMFVPSIRATELETDAIDDSVEINNKRSSSIPEVSPSRQVQTQAELFSRIASARKQVTQLIRLMSAKSELLRVIAKRCGTRFSDDALLYLRDLQDHTAMVDQTLHHYDDSLNRSHANYLAHINLEISETSNKMSDVMKKLTAISTVTLPWSMITGLMGMNIFVPGGKSYYTESWLPWLCLFIAMSSLSVLIYSIGRRRDWF